MKIVDCFIFYNELKLLDFRLEYLYDHVDHFVLVEATHTFAGNPKKLYFKTNKDRYTKYLDKIIYVEVKDMPHVIPGGNPWDNEIHQRNCIKRGLDTLTLNDGDKIVIGDLDEIPDVNMVHKIDDNNCYNLMMRPYFYDIEHFYDNINWMAAKMVNMNTINNKTIQEIRDTMFLHYVTCGWHLTYFGNVDFIVNKLANFSHQNYNTPQYNKDYMLGCLEKRKNPFTEKKRNIGYMNIKFNNYLPVIKAIGEEETHKKLLDLHNNDTIDLD